jgi:tRNA (cmo5U34)-methyltransferase
LASVASHLSVSPAAYDERIRELLPRYDELVSEAARALRYANRPIRHIVDLGIGTGALTRACLAEVPAARVVGIDADHSMVEVAKARLKQVRRRVRYRSGDFTRAILPKCDAVVATYALHHIRSLSDKLAFYRRCHRALRPGGILVSGDCMPASTPSAVATDLEDWFAHLARTAGSRSAAKRIFESWADEDTYRPLEVELRLLRRAGFTVDVPWRHAPFAVVAAIRPRERPRASEAR